ncbi:MAG: purine-nucleoside phosphorylase [Fidelibacterota bacterium]
MNPVIPEAVSRLKRVFPEQPAAGLILGSGLGDFAQQVENPVVVKYKDLPGYPRSTVQGHAGEFVLGSIGPVNVILARGRVHWYEGYSLETVTLPVHIFAELGAKRIILTNAAGSVDPAVPPGSFMLGNGYLDATFRASPEVLAYRGRPWINESWLIRARTLAQELNMKISTGTYCWTSGPAYETPAEVEYFRHQGAKAVGMSTVPEVLAAAELGLKSLSISALTNYAAGINDKPLSHNEVMETAAAIKKPFENWMRAIILNIPNP